LVEAETSPDTAPLVLWLNGGPGCSSLGGGLFSELGPFYPTKNGQALEKNVFRWTRNGSMIFLESPAFVGFSYSKEKADLVVGDERTTTVCPCTPDEPVQQLACSAAMSVLLGMGTC
jgi:serine carboxypeptidase-like clade II